MPSKRLSFLGCVLLCTILPAFGQTATSDDVPVPAERLTERRGDLVSIFSGDIHVPADTRQRGSVICIGGDVVVEGEVTRDVVVVLGTMRIEGKVGGAARGVLSDMTLENAEISRELVSVLGDLELKNSRVGREMINVLGPLDRDELSRVVGEFVNVGLGSWAPSFWAMLFWFRMFHKFSIFVLLLLVIALAPERIRAMSVEAPVRYAPAFFVGLLGYLGMIVLVTILSVTFIGVPVAIVGFWILKWMGIAAIFFAVGRRLGRVAGVELSLLGAVLVVFTVYVLVSMVPGTMGWGGLLILGLLRLMFFLIIEAPAVGLVILTRCGSAGGRDAVVAPQAPPAATAAPAASVESTPPDGRAT